MTPVAPRIVLESGGWFDFCNPDQSRFTLYDIAAGLARTCRFGGHTCDFYSVAEHSIEVAAHVHKEQEQLYALLHDASEAFLGDMVAPLKQLCPDFQSIEDMAQRHIYRHFGLDPDTVPESVKYQDLKMLHTELRELCNTSQWHATKWCEDNKISYYRNHSFDLMTPEKARKKYAEKLIALLP